MLYFRNAQEVLVYIVHCYFVR